MNIASYVLIAIVVLVIILAKKEPKPDATAES